MNTIVKIDLNDRLSGGQVYENQIVEVVDEFAIIKSVYIQKYNSMLLNVLRFFRLFVKYKFFFKGALVLTNSTTFFTGLRSKNIVLIHHIRDDYSNNLADFWQRYCDRYFIMHYNMYNIVVTVSEIWKKRFEKAGVKNVRVIYNSFNREDYTFNETEVNEFKKKNGMEGKTVVYIGNSRGRKGVEEAYKNLKNENYLLVTTGAKLIDIPVLNLNLSFKDYKLLLAASDVVLTMSMFAEGWNRIAHEASLCGTPVIGTGTGGMHELLQIAGQTELKDFTKLPEAIKSCLLEAYKPTEALLNYNNQYFKEQWINVFKDVEKY